MRVILNDGRQMTGQMLAFDKVRLKTLMELRETTTDISPQHMNLVLADTEEFRRVKRKPTKAAGAPGSAAPLVESEEKRTLGLAIVRGTHIISCSVDGPPPADPSARLGASAPNATGGAPPTMAAGTGISRPAGRGLPIGLTGPAAGVGGPGPGGFGGFPQGGFPGSAPPGFQGRGGPRMSLRNHALNDTANMSLAGFPPQAFPGGMQGGPRKLYFRSLSSRS